MKGFLVAGTASGVGKTTVTLAIAAALRRRGLEVQLFKGGPDFLDTGHHARVSGRRARNVDTWMLSAETNRAIVRRGMRGAEVGIVEGMMGLFDGKSGSGEEGSSAEIAKLLEMPVVLVVDAAKSARSVAAMMLGFELFDPELRLAGVVLNRVAGDRHFEMLRMAIEARCATPVLGWLPREEAIAIPERHLGLRTAVECGEEQIEAFAAVGERTLAIDRLLELECGLTAAGEAKDVTAEIRVGVAYDAAFNFYYEDNFELLRESGAELVYFSPLRDEELPPGLDALYLGGGYPELHAGVLSGNGSMLKAVREFAASGRPVYAECGGMMYLGESLAAADGSTHGMAEVLPLRVEMGKKLVRFGYVTVEFTQDCLLGPAGSVIRGHSFHYSNVVNAGAAETCYAVEYSLSGKREMEGFVGREGNVLGSYVHLHFRANELVARSFVQAAVTARVAGEVVMR